MEDGSRAQAAQSGELRKDRAQPKVSCLRCRDQKLKCSRELPNCIRCRKQNVECTYPSPPDRRRIAQRVSEAKAAGSYISSSDQSNHRRSSSGAKSTNRQRTKTEDSTLVVLPSPTRSSISQSESDISELADLPSTEVGLLLLEIYFKRVYNSTLLFHKAMVFDLYRQDGLPDYLLRAIFAHAAVFCQDVDTPHKDQIKIFSMQPIFERSWSWARCASKEVLSSADEPTLARIQTLQVLQLYYFSQGDSKRAKIHLSLAYQLGQLLEYPNLREEASSAITTQQLTFEREMCRRCFWAVWSSITLGESLSNFEGIREGVVGLPLPAKFEATASGLVQGRNLRLGQKMMFEWESHSKMVPPMMLSDTTSTHSLMAELVKCLGVWMNVKEFISELPTLSFAERTSKFERLVARAESVQRSSDLSVTNLCSRAESYNESPELVVSIYSAYVLSQVLLHASMVSKLVKMPLNALESNELAQRCSRSLLEHASTFARLSQLLLDQKLDLTRLWPLTGYGAYVVGNIFTIYRQKTLQSSTGTSLRIPGPGSGEMKAIQTVLEVSGVFWKPLRDFTMKLKQAMSTKSSSDLESVISFTYPWGTAYPDRTPDRTPGTPEHITAFDDDHSASVTQSHSPNTPISFEEPLMHLPSEPALSMGSFPPPTDHQSFLNAPTCTGSTFPDNFDFEYQAMDEDVLMQNTDRNPSFDANWWDVVSADNIQNYILPPVMHHPDN